MRYCFPHFADELTEPPRGHTGNGGPRMGINEPSSRAHGIRQLPRCFILTTCHIPDAALGPSLFFRDVETGSGSGGAEF